MDSRLYFVLGDLAGNILVGLVVGWLCSTIVGNGWNMFFTMLLTMALGMVVGLVLFFPLGILFGAMEVMLPLMFTGMVSGMVVGMWCTMESMTAPTASFYGAICGLVSIVTIWVINNTLRGLRTYGVEGPQ
jgi:hypothetical protein